MISDMTIKILLSACFLFATYTSNAGYVYVSEDFKGTTAANWTFVTGAGAGASLTAATGADPDGLGWLRMTNYDYNQSSFVYCNTPIPTNQGLVFNFDFAIWGRNSPLADGLALCIFDASATPAAGAYGGSLGYAQRSGVQGLAGAVMGVGFDEFGNFSNPSEGRVGGTEKTPNSIAIRGSMGADRTQGYEYITGTSTIEDFSTSGATSRAEVIIHTTRITITPDKTITVELKSEGGEWETLIDSFQCDLVCPEYIKFGYTSGTGSVRGYHEIRNLSVSSVPEPITLMFLSLGIIGVMRKKNK